VWAQMSPLTPAIVPRTRAGAATALPAASAQPAAIASTRERRYIVSSLSSKLAAQAAKQQTPEVTSCLANFY
jgi:hypothetical protein